MTQYRVGVVGTHFGQAHAEAYQYHPRVQLVAFAEPVPEYSRTFSEQYPEARAYESLETMLANEPLDIVSLCVPHCLHAPMTLAAAQAGVRVIYVEKPMALHLGEADAMIAACQQAKALLVVGHQRRLGLTWNAAKRILDSGELGAIHLVHTGWPWRKLEWQYAWSGGGALMYLATHSLDLFRLLLGDFAWVQAELVRAHPEYTIESNTRALLMSQNGVPALLETGEETAYTGTEILCEGGRLFIHDGALRVRRAGQTWEDVHLPWPLDIDENNRYHQAMRAMVESIVDWLDTGAPHPVSHVEGRAALELAMAIYESHRIGGQVTLPFTGTRSPLEQMIEEGIL